MPTPASGPSRGSQLLQAWQGELQSQQAADILAVDEATYSRFRNGIRKPSGEIGARIEKLTDGRIPAASWYEPPIEDRVPARPSALAKPKRARAS